MADSDFVVDGNHAVEFKLVKTGNDLHDNSLIFRPQMCHQIFGDDESIYGFKNLTIKLYYKADSLQVYCGFDYEAKLPGIEVSDLMRKVKTHYEFDIIENLQDFEILVNTEKVSPYGSLIGEFQDHEMKLYEIYYCTNSTPSFINFHQRLQTFLLWFIDAASYVDMDDSGWNFFVVFEKYHCGDEIRYSVVGYASVYDYYAYPEHIRPRISQVLILPPYQSKGLCMKLLFSLYNHYLAEKSNILDFTVEDPSEEFQRVRDCVDCKRVLEKDIINHQKLVTETRVKLIEDMHIICKINKKQARRVYEILKLKYLNRLNEQEFTNYRVEIKRRLNQPYQKQMKLVSKCKSGMTLQEVHDNIISDEDRKARLDLMFLETIDQYSSVISRLQNIGSNA
ncbi:histone acetyltransferase type B catalytic subunit-like [Halyomorpha halys]|uniref:histone acetyltransferase type B catalytic subunit-like n=1 Tax=Halyomorpha halys TaxID=286706 RepID=UPI0034D2E3FB